MAGCLDNVECGCLGDGSLRRNIIASVAAGTIFSIGWWIVIDAAAIYPEQKVNLAPVRNDIIALFCPNGPGLVPSIDTMVYCNSGFILSRVYCTHTLTRG